MYGPTGPHTHVVSALGRGIKANCALTGSPDGATDPAAHDAPLGPRMSHFWMGSSLLVAGRVACAYIMQHCGHPIPSRPAAREPGRLEVQAAPHRPQTSRPHIPGAPRTCIVREGRGYHRPSQMTVVATCAPCRFAVGGVHLRTEGRAGAPHTGALPPRTWRIVVRIKIYRRRPAAPQQSRKSLTHAARHTTTDSQAFVMGGAPTPTPAGGGGGGTMGCKRRGLIPGLLLACFGPPGPSDGGEVGAAPGAVSPCLLRAAPPPRRGLPLRLSYLVPAAHSCAEEPAL